MPFGGVSAGAAFGAGPGPGVFVFSQFRGLPKPSPLQVPEGPNSSPKARAIFTAPPEPQREAISAGTELKRRFCWWPVLRGRCASPGARPTPRPWSQNPPLLSRVDLRALRDPRFGIADVLTWCRAAFTDFSFRAYTPSTLIQLQGEARVVFQAVSSPIRPVASDT